jgi:hypothetical protein
MKTNRYIKAIYTQSIIFVINGKNRKNKNNKNNPKIMLKKPKIQPNGAQPNGLSVMTSP